MNRRRALLLLALAGCLALVALQAWAHLRASRHAADRARQGLVEVRRAAAKIEAARARPTRASDHERLEGEITGLIEEAAREAGIPIDRIISINPRPPRAVDETFYKEKATGVMLRGVTTEQLVRLCHHVLATDPALNVKSLRISAPRGDDTGRAWSVEFELTYLIYDPAESTG